MGLVYFTKIHDYTLLPIRMRSLRVWVMERKEAKAGSEYLGGRALKGGVLDPRTNSIIHNFSIACLTRDEQSQRNVYQLGASQENRNHMSY